MTKRRKRRYIPRTCSHIQCIKKDFCPNHTPQIKRDSIAFTSCMYFENNIPNVSRNKQALPAM